jgi:hypothetical protein
MNAFVWAAIGLLVPFLPLLAVAIVRRPIDGLVALECAGILLVLVLLCLAEGFHRSLIGGLVFARFLGRWL